jgi:hypothetical protein
MNGFHLEYVAGSGSFSGPPVRMPTIRAMGTVVTVLLIILGAAALVGGIVAFVAFRRAPGGFEDEKGFHHSNRPDKHP